jgi:hypothetical protein
MHSVKIHWISGYSQFAGGSIFMSYNVNKANKDTPFSVSSIFAQQSSGKSRLCENSNFIIPSSSWNQTPTRRSCQGAEDSYLFDLRYAVQTNETPQPISVWIEYDVTFHTPQIETFSSTPTSGGQYSVLKYGSGENVGKPAPVLITTGKYYWSVEGNFKNFYIGVPYLTPSSLDSTYSATPTVIAKYTIKFSNGSVNSYTLGYNHGSSTAANDSNFLYLYADDESTDTSHWLQYNATNGRTQAATFANRFLNLMAGATAVEHNAIQLYFPDGITKVEVDYNPVSAKQNFINIPY